MSGADRRFRFGSPFGFQMFPQSGHHFGRVALLEALLLGAPPLIRLGRAASRGGSAQIFADVKVAAPARAVAAKGLPTLQAYPVRGVPASGGAAVEGLAALPGAGA